MRSSRGFRVYRPQLVRPIQTRFRFAPPQNGLTLLVTVSRRIIMQKHAVTPDARPKEVHQSGSDRL